MFRMLPSELIRVTACGSIVGKKMCGKNDGELFSCRTFFCLEDLPFYSVLSKRWQVLIRGLGLETGSLLFVVESASASGLREAFYLGTDKVEASFNWCSILSPNQSATAGRSPLPYSVQPVSLTSSDVPEPGRGSLATGR